MRFLGLIFATLVLAHLSAAQAQDPRGYRGRWNNWAHEPMALDRGAWRVTVQAAATEDNEFKIAETQWAYEWTHDGPLPLGEVGTAFTGGENTEMEAVPGRFYSFAMDDVAYGAEGRMLVQETENPPVEIASVDHTVAESHATVTLATSAAPGPGERLFVRYTFNNWITSAFAEASGSGTNWTAEIPHAPENAGQTCAFYTLSTTVATPAHPAADLQTLRWNDNDGTAYSYAVPGEPPPARLYINEVLSSNDSSEQDEDGDYSDWLEIWNDSDTAVNLDGWGLSDSDSNPFKWMFGEVTIQPGEFLIVWASSKNRPAVTNGNQLHASFAISAGGEELLLTQPDGTPMDRFEPVAIPTDFSYGRQPDGTGPWKYFADHTPGAANTTTGYSTILEPPVYSIPGGFYTTNVDVALSTSQTGAVVRYTLDGSEPTEASPVFTNAFDLGSKAGTPNDLSDIPTNYESSGPPYYEDWQPPDGEVFKFHVVRARTFLEGALPSPAVAQSYVVDAAGTNRYTLPVISIATDAANLFDDDIGIYTPVNGNMWQSGSAWERPGTIEFFEPDGTLAFDGPIGVRLHGNTTRTRPRKALRIYSRGSGPFEYQIFPDKPVAEFDTFILRNGGNDWGNGVIRDLYLQSLAENARLDRQFGRPVLVFLNGEYWGLHDLRDRFDEDYILRHYDLDEDEFVQVEIDYAVSSSYLPIFDEGYEPLGEDYASLWEFMRTNNLSTPDAYAAVADRLDLGSFMDFFQANIFFANTDWPGNNLRAWRSVETNRTEDAPAFLDGRWRYMLYDADFGFGLNFFYVPGYDEFAQHDTLAFAASPDQTANANHPDATLMFRRLLENAEFRRDFVTRFCDQLNTAYSCAHVTNRWAQWVALLAPEMDEHAARWRQPTNWTYECDRIRAYGEQRTDAVWGHIQNYFGLAAPVNLTIVVTNAAAGFVRINSLNLDDATVGFSGYPWTGAYFTNWPVALTAVPQPGFRFVEWRQDSVPAGTDPALEVALSTTTEMEAVFEADPAPVVAAPIDFQQWIEGAEPAIFDLAAVFADPESQPLKFSAMSSDPGVAAVGLTNAELRVFPFQRGDAEIAVVATDGLTPVTNVFRVLVYPRAHVLADGAFSFGAWDPELPEKTYPEHMLFLQSDQNDTALDTPLLHPYFIAHDDYHADDADKIGFPYKLTGRTRLNGLGTNGLAFINTGRGRDLGGALLALDTRGVSNAPVSWLGGTVLANVRVYAVRLQYRVGLTNDFADVLDSEGQPVEYVNNATNGHVQTLGPVQLPAAALGQECVQLLWRYYRVSGSSGARAQLRLDEIGVDNRGSGFSAWQQDAFTPEELADPDVSGPLAESGGIPNLLRYAFGLDRAGNFAAVRPTAEVLENVRVFRHRRLLADDSGVDYVVESASDLQLADWDAADVGTDLIDQGAVPTGDGQTETVEYHLDDDLLPSPRYIRLKVTLTE
jgi:hypothetical protein